MVSRRPRHEAHVGSGAPAGTTSRAFDALAAVRDHAVIAAALDPIITIDAFGRIESASDSVQRVFGWAPAELVGRNVNVLMPEPYHSAHDGHLTMYRRTGRSAVLGQRREFEGVRKDGERFPLELSVSRVEPPGAAPPLFVGIIRDLTERKRMERELQLVKELALAISGAEGLTEALVATIRLVCVATGWDYGEAWMPTEDGQELAGSASWAPPASGLERFAETATTHRFRSGVGLPGCAWKTGHPVWAGDLTELSETEFCRPEAARDAGLRAAAAVPVLSENAPIAVLVFFVRAIRRKDTHLLDLVGAAVAPLGPLIQRRRAEDALSEYRRRLEERVEERTRALRDSQNKLRMADRLASIGTLAAGLGHDMNNVLLPMRAHLNVLGASSIADRLAHGAQVAKVQQGVAYLQQLADGLHFLAMDPDGTDDAGGSTALHSWWAQTGALLRKAVPKEVRVIASLRPDLPEVAIPAHALTQAVLNLIVNAGEAIPAPAQRKRRQGYVRLAAELGPGGSSVRLAVSDNGCGMTDEVRRRAFDMFFTTKPRGLGTGLGLAMVRKVVDRAGGSVEVESTVGHGTTITLTMPVRDAGAARRAPSAVVRVSDGRAASLVRGLLDTAGAKTDGRRGQADADIWIVEPSSAGLADAQAWRKKRPTGRLVLFGRPPDRSARAWRTLQPVVIERPDDLDAIREALTAAMTAL